MLGANTAQNQDQLNAELANAYETFGNNIDLSKLAQSLGMTQADLQNVLGPDVQKIAQENTDAGLSTQARLQQQNDQAKRTMMADLNKRGLLHSGETGYEADQLNTSYRQAQSDAYQKFLGYLQQYQQGYLSAQNANAGKLADAISSAATRQAGLNQGSAGVSAQLDHIDANGRAVYKGADGNFYNADGTPYSAPVPNTTPPPAPTPLSVADLGYQQTPRNTRVFGAA